MRRTFNVIRLQMINRQTFIWVPLIVLAGATLISVLIYAMIPGDSPKYGGRRPGAPLVLLRHRTVGDDAHVPRSPRR